MTLCCQQGGHDPNKDQSAALNMHSDLGLFLVMAPAVVLQADSLKLMAGGTPGAGLRMKLPGGEVVVPQVKSGSLVVMMGEAASRWMQLPPSLHLHAPSHEVLVPRSPGIVRAWCASISCRALRYYVAPVLAARYADFRSARAPLARYYSLDHLARFDILISLPWQVWADVHAIKLGNSCRCEPKPHMGGVPQANLVSLHARRARGGITCGLQWGTRFRGARR